MRESVSQIMSGISADRHKRIANNTVEYWKDGVRTIRLHSTDIMTFYPDGRIRLDSGGWQTITTKDRMNKYLPAPYRITQAKGQWTLRSWEQDFDGVPYFDGIDFYPAKGLPKPKAGLVEKNEKLGEKIRKFAARINKLDKLPEPNSGDCWDCLFHDKHGKTMGELSKSDHLRSHVEEGYLHGSLIVNAMKARGYGDTAIAMAFSGQFPRSNVSGAVRRYLRAKLGLST